MCYVMGGAALPAQVYDLKRGLLSLTSSTFPGANAQNDADPNLCLDI